MNGGVADHRLRARLVQPRMFFEEPRVGNHVVVEEQEHIVLRYGRPVIAGACGAGVALLNYLDWKWAFDRNQRFGSCVGRTVDDNNDLDRAGIIDRDVIEQPPGIKRAALAVIMTPMLL